MPFMKSLSAALMAATLLTSAAQAEPEQKDVTIAVGGKVALYYLPLNIADLKGYFADEGLNVQIVDFQGGSKSVQAVVGGSADVLSSSFEHVVNLQALGRDFVGIVLQGRYPGFALSVTPELGETWTSAADLKGKKVGVTAPGSSTNAMVNLLLKKAGLTPDDVAIIGIGAGAGVLAAVQQGQVDAVVQADPATTLLVDEGLAKVVVDTRTAEGSQEVYGGPMPAASLSVPQDFAEENPETVQALVNAMENSLQFLQTATAEEILEVLPSEMMVGGDRDAYLKMIEAVRPSYSPDGRFTDEAMNTVLAVMKEENEAVGNAEIDMDATYTNEFIDKAIAGE
ncbi:ABC transporter substrate-binding protein [Aurantimonas endophytica]|uniref:NitT/TauT family transport system substrate-binding protein n=1 Tax=Aurantimonas endophytica TaxID=1522175 RepID=A0A7W6HCE0_9HYPH|nr:ABC transporter substrate-binding protein [Aurantimonas endophytica]MBB4002576.1 NitT/TauT family transport system substrate-binding protein [Aurantimonas endophytica]MCO6403457.1 ABC transporter substrate-binding protein [Aurantimonas endophytica]